MQVLNVVGFEKRILYNACKAYVNQLNKGDAYRLLTGIVAVTITDFVMFPTLQAVVSQFELCARENTALHYQDLALVFAELPKFKLTEAELTTPLDRWLYFLKTTSDLTTIPTSLTTEPAILQALELANRVSWTEDELDDVEKREMWLSDQRYLREQLEHAELRRIEAEQRGVEKGLELGRLEGEVKGKVELLLRLLNRRFNEVPDALVLRIETATTEQLDRWTERLIDASVITDVFNDREYA